MMSLHWRKDTRISVLRGVDLLSDCTTGELQRIASSSTATTARAGQILAREGEPGTEFFIIIEGTAQASRNGSDIATLSAPSFFGELALLDGGERTATVAAMTDLHLLVLSRQEFHGLCSSCPSVTRKMLKELACRLRRADALAAADDDRRVRQV